MFKKLFDKFYNWITLLILSILPDTYVFFDLLQLVIGVLTVIKLTSDIIIKFKNRKK